MDGAELAGQILYTWLTLVLGLILLPSAFGVSLGISEIYMKILVKTLEVSPWRDAAPLPRRALEGGNPGRWGTRLELRAEETPGDQEEGQWSGRRCVLVYPRPYPGFSRRVGGILRPLDHLVAVVGGRKTPLPVIMMMLFTHLNNNATAFSITGISLRSLSEAAATSFSLVFITSGFRGPSVD